MNTVDKTAVEKGIAEMIKPLTKMDKNFAAPEQRGMSELLIEAAQKLEDALHNVRLAQELLRDFYNGGGKP